MKIRIVLADQDQNYINHFSRAMKIFFFNKVEVVAFSKEEALKRYLAEKAYDVFLAAYAFLQTENSMGVKIALAEKKEIKEIRGTPAVCKYQKIEQIYREVLNILAETQKEITYSGSQEMDTKIIAFSSAAGGMGKTTVAMAYARNLAEAGYSTLFLSLENFSILDTYFREPGEMGLSNILFALKCGKGNLQLKVESAMRQVYGNIYYLNPAENPSEVSEIEQEEWKVLFREIGAMGKFHCVVLDLPDMFCPVSQSVAASADRIIIVTDGREKTTAKARVMLDWYRRRDDAEKTNTCGKMAAIQNRSDGTRVEFGIPVIAVLPAITSTDNEEKVISLLTTHSAGRDLLRKIYRPGGEAHV